MHIDTHGIHGKEVSLGMMEHGSQSNQGNKSTSFSFERAFSTQKEYLVNYVFVKITA